MKKGLCYNTIDNNMHEDNLASNIRVSIDFTFQDRCKSASSQNQKSLGTYHQIDELPRPLHCVLYKHLERQVLSKVLTFSFLGWFHSFMCYGIDRNAHKNKLNVIQD